ncbi:hypothetical protein, partial [Streptomyces lydicus]|uniref:hypothetical protein n=1 Tax=Streptomyces lydicus TaxID=47763 RepID=UPI00332172CB
DVLAAEAAVDTAEGTEAAPAKPKRTRKAAAAKPAVDGADAAEATEAKPVRRRTRAKAPAAEATPES